MGGLGLTLDISKKALFASQRGLAVSGNNVSNVSTPKYSRQHAKQIITRPINFSGEQFGTGVEIEAIRRTADELLERRINAEASTAKAYEESQAYMTVLATLFNENSENSLSKSLSDFWNTWHDLSNHPTGTAERTAVRENGILLSEQLNGIYQDIMNLDHDLTLEIVESVNEVNSITRSIADLNREIARVEVSSNANDQRDHRNRLLLKLAEFVDIKSFEQETSDVTVMMTKGTQLVNRSDNNNMKIRDGRLIWIGSNKTEVDITDKVAGGKLGGWLEMRDEVVSKFRSDLNSLTKGMIWLVNNKHSGGVGLDFFKNKLEGTYSTDDTGSFETLSFGNKIDYTKDFKMWVKKLSSLTPLEGAQSVVMDMGLSDSELEIPVYPGSADASTKYTFTVTKSGTIGSSVDLPEIAWKKTNMITGKSVSGLSPMPISYGVGNLNVDGLSLTLKPGYLVAGNTFTMNTDAITGEPDLIDVRVNPIARANSILDSYLFTVEDDGGGKMGTDKIRFKWKNGTNVGTFVIDPRESTMIEVDGLEIDFGFTGTLFDGDSFSITTDTQGKPKVHKSSDWHWTIDSFKNEFNRKSSNTGVSATLIGEGRKLRFTAEDGVGFAFSDSDTEESGVLAALGFNTFFNGNDSGSIKVNGVLDDLNKVAVAQINGGNRKGIISDSKILSPVEIDTTNNIIHFNEDDGTGLVDQLHAVLAPGTYVKEAEFYSLAQDIERAMERESKRKGKSIDYSVRYSPEEQKIIFKEEGGSSLRELRILWGSSTAAPKLGFDFYEDTYLPPDGDYGHGDNTNALGIADLQFERIVMPTWNFIRGISPFSDVLESSIEGYYQGLTGSMGTKAAAIERGLEFSNSMVDKLKEQRENLSGVSLDEEMISIMKYQQAYTAASKLLKTSDEMLQTILAIK